MSEVTRDEFDRLQRQVEKNTERLASGDADLAVIKTELRQIVGKLDKLDSGVEALQQKPVKRWESVSSTVIQWLVTALLAFIAVKIGLN